MNSKVTPPKPALQEPDEQATEPIKPHIFGATDLVQPSESPQANNKNANQPDDSTAQPQAEQESPPVEPEQGIPTLQLVLFLGGAVLCVGGLVAMRVLKKRREYDDEDDE